MPNPKYSILTPTFNRPLMLQRALRSVVNQTFSDYEHIIIDDANDPATDAIVAGFNDKRIKLIKQIKPVGAAGSYNSGIRYSKGRFLLFLDDDDEYLPTFLEKIDTIFSHEPENVGFIWTGIARVLDAEQGEELLYEKVWPARFKDKESGMVEATSIGNGFGVCVRRECIDDIGIYDESLVIGEDTDLLFRLAIKYDCLTIPEVLVRIHQHNKTQLTGDLNYLRRIKFKEIILKRYNTLLQYHPRLFYVHYKSYADLCYKSDLKKKGIKAMLAIIRKRPLRLRNYTDLLLYELTGKDSFSMYSKLKILLRIKK